MKINYKLVFAVLSILFGMFMFGNSLYSLFTIGFSNMTIVKVISLFFSIFLILEGCIFAVIIIKKSRKY